MAFDMLDQPAVNDVLIVLNPLIEQNRQYNRNLFFFLTSFIDRAYLD